MSSNSTQSEDVYNAMLALIDEHNEASRKLSQRMTDLMALTPVTPTLMQTALRAVQPVGHRAPTSSEEISIGLNATDEAHNDSTNTQPSGQIQLGEPHIGLNDDGENATSNGAEDDGRLDDQSVLNSSGDATTSDAWTPPLPPSGPFATAEEADHALKQFAIDNGFAIANLREQRVSGPGSAVHKIWRPCACHGEYKPKDQGVPLCKKGSKKTGCGYMAILKGVVNKGVVGEWSIKLSDTVGSGTHTGHMQLTMAGLKTMFQARRFTQNPTVSREIQNMIEAGTKPREILATINKHTSRPLVTIKEITNQNSKTMENILQGRSPLTALLDTLSQSVEQGVVTDVVQNEENVLTHLFFQTDREMAKLLEKFGDVLIMDCTYRTNRHRMPLLHVVGITDTFHSFSGAFMLMANETTEDYKIALDRLTASLPKPPHVVVIDCDTAFIAAVKAQWPNTKIILCRWHLWQNIKKHCQKNFVDDDEKHDAEAFSEFKEAWMELESATTEESFFQLWEQMEKDIDKATFAYLEKNKMPLRQHWASVFIDKHQHLNATVTSRVEGKHWASIKSNGSANSTIFTLYQTIKRNCDQQMANYQAAVVANSNTIHRFLTEDDIQEKQKKRFITRVKVKPFYSEVNQRLSLHILTILDQERIKADRIVKANDPNTVLSEGSLVLKPCTSWHRTVMGMPCAHEILAMRREDRGLKMSDFTSRWHLQPVTASSEVLEPPVGRFTNSTHGRGNKRLRTSAEIAESQLQASQRHCGVCQARGHDRTQCPSALVATQAAQTIFDDISDLNVPAPGSSSEAPRKIRAAPRCSGCGSSGDTYKSCAAKN